MDKIKYEYPQFVRMGGNTALRLVKRGRFYSYYRDGGAWEVDIHRFANGDLITVSNIGSLNGIKLRPITETEWRDCNGQYAPDKFERYGWELNSNYDTNPCVEITLTETMKNNNKYLLIRR